MDKRLNGPSGGVMDRRLGTSQPGNSGEPEDNCAFSLKQAVYGYRIVLEETRKSGHFIFAFYVDSFLFYICIDYDST